MQHSVHSQKSLIRGTDHIHSFSIDIGLIYYLFLLLSPLLSHFVSHSPSFPLSLPPSPYLTCIFLRRMYFLLDGSVFGQHLHELMFMMFVLTIRMALMKGTVNPFLLSVHTSFIWENTLSTGALLPGKHMTTDTNLDRLVCGMSFSLKWVNTVLHLWLSGVSNSLHFMSDSPLGTLAGQKPTVADTCKRQNKSNSKTLQVKKCTCDTNFKTHPREKRCKFTQNTGTGPPKWGLSPEIGDIWSPYSWLNLWITLDRILCLRLCLRAVFPHCFCYHPLLTHYFDFHNTCNRQHKMGLRLKKCVFFFTNRVCWLWKTVINALSE